MEHLFFADIVTDRSLESYDSIETNRLLQSAKIAIDTLEMKDVDGIHRKFQELLKTFNEKPFIFSEGPNLSVVIETLIPFEVRRLLSEWDFRFYVCDIARETVDGGSDSVDIKNQILEMSKTVYDWVSSSFGFLENVMSNELLNGNNQVALVRHSIEENWRSDILKQVEKTDNTSHVLTTKTENTISQLEKIIPRIKVEYSDAESRLLQSAKIAIDTLEMKDADEVYHKFQELLKTFSETPCFGVNIDQLTVVEARRLLDEWDFRFYICDITKDTVEGDGAFVGMKNQILENAKLVQEYLRSIT